MITARHADASLFNEQEFVEIYVVAKIAALEKGFFHAKQGWKKESDWYDLPELQAEYNRGFENYFDDEAEVEGELAAMFRERAA